MSNSGTPFSGNSGNAAGSADANCAVPSATNQGVTSPAPGSGAAPSAAANNAAQTPDSGAATQAQHFSATEIAALLPHGDPFLFVQKATLEGREIRGSYTITGNEDLLRGHFKGRPVFPASVMLEALGQLAVLYLLVASDPNAPQAPDPDLPRPVNPEQIFFTSCDGVRCQRVCTPGDTLEMVIRPKRLRHPASAFEGSISVNGERAVFAEKITLVFDFQS